jgi:glycosyltransferase involved in cell wall biosynthesis
MTAVPEPPAATDAADERAPVRLSVCIPAFNRPRELRELLDSIAAQDYPHFDVVISEDASPERAAIRAVVDAYQPALGGRIRYFENPENLGYDANFRQLIRRATGDFCFIMGNDDLVAPGALATVAGAIRRTPEAASCCAATPTSATARGVHHDRPLLPRRAALPAGPDTVELFYRRAASMSGLVLRRADALALETDQYDGRLWYQMHLVANLLMRRPGVIVPEVLAYYREGNRKEFGTSARERGRFTPGEAHDIAEALRLLEGTLVIARGVDAAHGTDVYRRVRRDLARHSFHTFAHHGEQSAREYLRLYRGLAALGFWRYPLFHASAVAVAAAGPRRLHAVVHSVRRRLGYTPSLGERPRRAEVLRSPALGARPHLAPPARAGAAEGPGRSHDARTRQGAADGESAAAPAGAGAPSTG